MDLSLEELDLSLEEKRAIFPHNIGRVASRGMAFPETLSCGTWYDMGNFFFGFRPCSFRSGVLRLENGQE